MTCIKPGKDVVHALPNGHHLIRLGDMEIWDGADLALLREAMTFLYGKYNSRQFGVDMSFVKYVPSGFFGMLFDWHEQKVCVRLYNPQPHVARMLWFTKFFREVEPGAFQLCPEAHDALTAPLPPLHELTAPRNPTSAVC